MSEIRDTSEALNDEGNASSSTPLKETATKTEGSAKGNATAADAISQSKSGTSTDHHIFKKEESRKMSEIRDTSEALNDEGNASSSTPLTETATKIKGSAKGNATAADAISQSKSGGGFVSRINDYPLPITDTLCESQRLVRFLFQMELTQSDIEHGSLSIPFEKARLHFLPMNRVSIHQIVITNTRNDNWFMTLTYNAPKASALTTSGWQGFVDWHGLKALDVIRFYKLITSANHIQSFQTMPINKPLPPACDQGTAFWSIVVS
ncbi:unnamed protein product [Camellia sinensis]